MCLKETYAEHLEFYGKYKVSKFYGDRHKRYGTSQGRAQDMLAAGIPRNIVKEILPQQEGISCIGLTKKCLGEGFEAAGAQETWHKIDSYLDTHGNLGTDLITMLQLLGWRIYYWNPDPSKNIKWDIEDRKLVPLADGKVWMPVWGGHEQRYQMVMKKNIYFNMKVDDKISLVDFKTEIPSFFKENGFFVGTAHAGYHVFSGTKGKVIEGHSSRPITSVQNLEFSDFNPIAPGGGPKWTRTEKYRSGVVALPVIEDNSEEALNTK